MEQTDTPKRRNDQKIRSDRTWTLIRERYLAGQSAPRLAGVFDVTEAAIRRRAGRQGWTKRSLADAVAGLLDGDLTPREAARLALGEAARRKVPGLTSPSAEADGEDRPARERRPGGGDADGRGLAGPRLTPSRPLLTAARSVLPIRLTRMGR